MLAAASIRPAAAGAGVIPNGMISNVISTINLAMARRIGEH
jgi:hypothetical protein